MKIATPAAPAAPVSALETCVNFLVRILIYCLDRAAPLPLTDKAGAPVKNGGKLPASLHQSYSAKLQGEGNTVVSFPSPSALYAAAVAAGEIAAETVPTYQMRPRFDKATKMYGEAVMVQGGVRVPSFIEAVNLAAASGKVIAFGYGSNRRLSLPGRMTEQAPAVAPAATAALAMIPR